MGEHFERVTVGQKHPYNNEPPAVLTLEDTRQSVAVILGAITQELVNGGRAEIRGFGSFNVHARAPRLGRNPKTGERVKVPAKGAVHFKPSKELREVVDWRSAG